MHGFALQSDRPSCTKRASASTVDPNEHSRVVRNRNVLVIDDDIGTRETFERILRLEGFLATTAATGQECIELAKLGHFDLIFVDLRLPDLSGIDVLVALREFSSACCVLMSAFLTVHTAVEAMKLGTFDVIEKPLDVEHIVALARRATQQSDTRLRGLRNEPWHDRVITAPRSIVERWVGYVMKVCDATEAENGGDFKTLEEWARRVAVSYSTLCETCRLLGLRPLDARNFARVLSTLRSAIVHGCTPEVLLNVSNRRVLRALSRKAGVSLEVKVEEIALSEFLINQRFIPQGCEALRFIHAFNSDWLVQRRNERNTGTSS